MPKTGRGLSLRFVKGLGKRDVADILHDIDFPTRRTFHRGAILAYRLFHTYGEPAIAFSVEGDPRGLDQHPPEGESFVRIGNKTLTGETVTRVFGLAERA